MTSTSRSVLAAVRIDLQSHSTFQDSELCAAREFRAASILSELIIAISTDHCRLCQILTRQRNKIHGNGHKLILLN